MITVKAVVVTVIIPIRFFSGLPIQIMFSFFSLPPSLFFSHMHTSTTIYAFSSTLLLFVGEATSREATVAQ
tara:strand:+ start:347 stop:559 length:213 start_codon:yes stop_codon:yes gene_type:complete